MSQTGPSVASLKDGGNVLARKEPNNNTIELSNGGLVHVAHTASEIETRIWDAENVQKSRFVVLERMTAFDSRASRGFLEVRIDPRHIVAIFPLASRAERTAGAG